MIIHKKLPTTGCWKVRYVSEMYRLLPRKRQLYRDNRELRYGMRYLIWSRFSRTYYERTLSLTETEENIEYYIAMQWVWLWPTEEQQEEIREEVEKAGIGYFKLRYRQQNEMEWEDLKDRRNTGNGYRWRLKHTRSQIDNLKQRKK